ncbi:Rad1-domain-containing protein [Fomitiporia mediterranea MF3/22]|uniref:Rad1-domain-containing protein n=1 Tax=Fomitiporia mediterranea (strain MF3/22) TaxID=694068 RepID=UPI00044092B6|nr:Rad1-domain-containing protein [Fomitiporia mediterranea MF3/22]EJD05934.1 Rad1-domain-containing protein [Fomitiporia mediterranea MF3/22]
MSDGLTSRQTLKATIPDIRVIATLLRGLCLSGTNQRAVLTIMKRGLAVSIEEARTLSGRVILWPVLFDEYVYEPEDENTGSDDDEEGPWTTFSIQLNILLECLNIFGTASGSASSFPSAPRQAWNNNRPEESDNEEQAGGADGRKKKNTNGKIDSFFLRTSGRGTGMRLSYTGPGYPLVLHLAESSDGPTTTCELVTYEPDDQLSLEIDSQDIVIKCIFKSSWLRDALSEVDPSCEKITFIGNPTVPETSLQRGSPRPLFRIQAVGPFGSTEIDYPNDREVLEAFECDSNVSYSYRFSHIIKTLRALQSSSKTSLRIDGEGVLSLQYLSTSPNPNTGAPVDSIVDYWCLSIDESTA